MIEDSKCMVFTYIPVIGFWMVGFKMSNFIIEEEVE